MEECKMTISTGVATLLVNAHKPIPAGARTFTGDLCQMAKAAGVAMELGFEVGVGGGIPYVKSQEEYEKVVAYLRAHKIEGYWHYE